MLLLALEVPTFALLRELHQDFVSDPRQALAAIFNAAVQLFEPPHDVVGIGRHRMDRAGAALLLRAREGIFQCLYSGLVFH